MFSFLFFLDNSSIFYIRQINSIPIPDPSKKEYLQEEISDIKKQFKEISTEVQMNSDKLRYNTYTIF